MRYVPGEVKIFSRIKLPPPLPLSRDSLPSGAIFEIVSVANCEEVKGGKCVGNYPAMWEMYSCEVWNEEVLPTVSREKEGNVYGNFPHGGE